MTKIEQLIESAKLYLADGQFFEAAQRLRQAADLVAAQGVEAETHRDYPHEFEVSKPLYEQRYGRANRPTEKPGVVVDHLGNQTAGGTMPIVEHDPIEQHLAERNRRDTLKRAGIDECDCGNSRAMCGYPNCASGPRR